MWLRVMKGDTKKDGVDNKFICAKLFVFGCGRLDIVKKLHVEVYHLIFG